MEAYASWTHACRVSCTQEPFTEYTSGRKHTQNINLAQDCIQPWLQCSNACHIYHEHICASMIWFISHTRLLLNDMPIKLCGHWNGKITNCFLFADLKSDVSRLWTELWMLNLWSSLRSRVVRWLVLGFLSMPPHLRWISTSRNKLYWDGLRLIS